MPAVNPKILIWARTTADLSLEEAAHAIDLNDAYGKTGAQRLKELEDGIVEPTRPLLLKISQKYRRPLLVFYLSAPPPKGNRGQDFRTVAGGNALPYDANLDALIRDIKARQGLAKSLLEDEDAKPLPFIGSSRITDEHGVVANKIISVLKFNLEDFRGQKDASDAFKYLRQLVENCGIFVLLIGDLGNYRSAITAETFRGFASSDAIAPFVVINDHDARAAWSFTVLHEVAHLWLGTTGISGSSSEIQIERFCNDVAGDILLPVKELNSLRQIADAPFEDVLSQISFFAQERNVSRAMVAFNLLKVNMIDPSLYQMLDERFKQDWATSRERTKTSESRAKGGPNYYVVRRHRLGRALLDLVERSLSEGTISPTKAGKLLGVKPRSVERLLSNVYSAEVRDAVPP